MHKIIIKTVFVSLTLLTITGCGSDSEFKSACDVYAFNNSEGMIDESIVQEICSCTDDRFSDMPEKSVTVLTELMQKNVPKNKLGYILVNKLSKEKATEVLGVYSTCGFEVMAKYN
ncbi:MAG: hypothetical protein DRG78_07695 [Epsilonproteobacteria bacterium]|nr:MAG: hypothetical protein DRG78_07695 [Campylobacterota bacterium]